MIKVFEMFFDFSFFFCWKGNEQKISRTNKNYVYIEKSEY